MQKYYMKSSSIFTNMESKIRHAKGPAHNQLNDPAFLRHKSSCLHCNIYLSFCSFSYNKLCLYQLKLSVNGFLVSQKGSNGDGKLKFLLSEF